ncbi:Major facilitator superfamily sugar transporter [Teratosphaeria destructans]|uniref:Major facilitator superfamily sugar transporter n=1 Tax=Teratosphaeria destructans TaxID=418781 RepID=A0A9W7SV82_9PEZI|nr:Major facilitator superfamily sugar transporter [Teratosphaeria destructans]
MANEEQEPVGPPPAALSTGKAKRQVNWQDMLGRDRKVGIMGKKKRNTRAGSSHRASIVSAASSSDSDATMPPRRPEKWTMGILNDPETEEVPGSILLLSKVSDHNEPLGLRNAPARTSASSLPISPTFAVRSRSPSIYQPEKKRTADGKIILEPQPDESHNDPLNWPVLRRDLALLSLGFYCLLGGGMTPILAAGFKQVSSDYGIAESSVALTTGLYMLGLGLGSVVLSPTAILFGKRPVYLGAAICFVLSSVWCALSPNFASLIVARIFMGLSVSSVECLPSASIAEIFFLHEKAYRLGIYTMLLLGGKNLIPLVSAAIIQSLGWRWTFWIVAIVVGFCWFLLFFFVPETFWDRTPRPHHRHAGSRRSSHGFLPGMLMPRKKDIADLGKEGGGEKKTIAERRAETRHARFAEPEQQDEKVGEEDEEKGLEDARISVADQPPETTVQGEDEKPATPAQAHLPVPTSGHDYFVANPAALEAGQQNTTLSPTASSPGPQTPTSGAKSPNPYMTRYRTAPPKTYVQLLRPWSGRLSKDKWLRVAFRPFILFCYPAILWSSLIYMLSVGWLIVLSESVSYIYENSATYNFTALQTGLVYISPFIGGILGTAVAGKVSDFIVRAMARRNGGIYEPEFRLIMALPILLFTTLGLTGYGWSAASRDAWIVPTLFFGFISFGCTMGSTTAITFAVDSYRQYAGEALVTLNFSKNIFHGLVFSLFFNRWLVADGSRLVFGVLGAVHVACLLLTVPMYVFGKRARMWTVRANLMERF